MRRVTVVLVVLVAVVAHRPGRAGLLRLLRRQGGQPSSSTRRRRWCWSATSDKTVLTMANDFKGDPKEFALVVPVPTVLEKGQIRVSDRALIEHLDAYSAPRLVEYFDEDPCAVRVPSERPLGAGQMRAANDAALPGTRAGASASPSRRSTRWASTTS